MRRATPIIFVAILVLVVGTATAPASHLFSDVPTAALYHAAAEWLANRGVTLGCATGLYCPDEFVTRGQMALFMQRLGVALTDTVLSQTESTAARDIDANPVICQTSDYAPTFPQAARIDGMVTATGSDLTYLARPLYSVNGGATWFAVNMISGGSQTRQSLPAGAATSDTQTVADHLSVMTPGVSYRFGIQLGRWAGTSDPSAYCILRVYVMNRN